MKKFTLVKELLPLFIEKMNKLSKKFEKYGSCSFNQGESYVCSDKNHPWYGYNLVDIEVDAYYKLGDFEFVASLEWLPELNENIIKKVSDDVFVPSKYKKRNKCDHCRTNRQRKYTVVLKDGFDNYIQVGKSCVKDYIGVDLGQYASYLSFFDSLEDFIECHDISKIQRAQKNYTVDEILCQAIEETRRNGYISKSVAMDNCCDSTSTRVFHAMVGSLSLDGKPLYTKWEVTDETNQQVKEIKHFYETINNDDSYVSNDYIENIRTILKVEWVGLDKLGLVVSAVGSKIRMENEKREQSTKVKSSFVGAIGDRITFTAVPECVYSTHSEFGFYYIYKMIVDNNEIIWKTSKDLEPDAKFEFTATIKSHEEFRGNKQTEITRARTKKLSQ